MDNLSRSLLIQVDHKVFGSARSSGLQLDNVIITHGSLLYFLCSNDVNDDNSGFNKISKNWQTAINELMSQQFFVKSKETHKDRTTFSFKILRSSDQTHIDESDYVGSKQPPGQCYYSEEALLCLVFKYEEDAIFKEILNLGDISGQNNICSNINSMVAPVFLFLMTGVPNKHLFEKKLYSLLKILKGLTIYPGLSIAVESTPFGSIPFHNSLSRGIVSKILGSDEEGFLIDSRLVLGCEGAPIYIFKDGVKGVVFGIVVFTILRTDEEWIGFSLGLSLKHILTAVLGLKAEDYIPFNKLKPPDIPSLLNTEQLSSGVMFVRCQHKWGSGVVIDDDLGLILTCSHIVHHAQDSVYVVFKGKKHPCIVEYATAPSDHFDLALLSVGAIPGLQRLVMAEESPVVGESVTTVGYALSKESSVIAGGTPTFSAGCVSKVSRGGGPLQTTCCTNSGVSGGAVIRPPDQLIGIVVSNIRMGSSVLPFFSFAVSVDDFRDSIGQFIKTKDPSYLRSLTVKSPEVKMKWMLQESKL